MRNETTYVKHVLSLKPDDVWWWNIPTQMGKVGIRPPFDVICCIAGMCVALEFKWKRFVAKPHQKIALGKVFQAGGLGLIVCGEEEGSSSRVYVYPYTDSCARTVLTRNVWPHIFDLVHKKS